MSEVFLKLPWRAEILRALLQYDLIGFQTVRDRRHFIDGLQYLWPEVKVVGRGAVQTVRVGEREVRVGAFPISIDFGAFAKRATSKSVAERAWYLHEAFPERRIILGVDRLDYTKGLPERLRAFGTALDRYPDLRRKVSLIQVVVPSREDVPAYKELKTRIEVLVSQINGKHTEAGWIPIHYLYRSLDFEELLAFYRTAEVGLVTPLKDGMNLVCKEYCACNIDQNGVLILSEFAGAVAQLHRCALVVNPHDVEGMAEVIHRAVNLPDDERRQRMVKLRESVKRHDIFWWVNTYLSAAFSKRLGDFPPVEEYVPRIARPDFGVAGMGGAA